jgi:hypothetical protein
MTEPKRYFVQCITEDNYIMSDYSYDVPTTCPNNPSHTIDPSQTIYYDTRTVKTFFTAHFTSSVGNTRYLQLYGSEAPGNRNRVCQFSYDGTNNTTPIVKVEAIVSNGTNSGATGIMDLRPWNIGTTGAYGTGSIYLPPYSEPVSVYINEIINIPAEPSVLEVGMTVIGNENSMRIHSLIIQQIFE